MPNNPANPGRGNHFGGNANRPRPQRNQQRKASPSETTEFTAAYLQSKQQGGHTAAGNAGARRTSSAQQAASHATRAKQMPASRMDTPVNSPRTVNPVAYSNDRGKRPRGNGKKIGAAVAIVLAVILCATAVCGALLYRDARGIMDKTQGLMAQADTIKEAISSSDSTTLSEATASIATQVSEMHQTTDGPLWQAASFIPVIGQDIQSARTVMSEMDSLCQSALIPGVDALTTLQQGSLFVDGAINIDLVSQLLTSLQDITPSVQASAQTIEALPQAHIPQLEEALGKVRGIMGQADDLLTKANDIAPYLPQMLGAGGQTRTYLILAQNNAEIRSNGGYPGAVGTLSITDGRMSLGEFTAVWQIPYYEGTIEGTEGEVALCTDRVVHKAGDSGMVPDFARSSWIFNTIWTAGGGQQVNGIVSIDPVLLGRLIGLTGGFTTTNGTQVTGDNAARLLIHDSYLNMSSEETDLFFADVAANAFKNLTSNLGSASTSDLVTTLMQAMDEGRFLAWMANEDEENAIDALGCSGRLSADEQDPELGVYVNDDTYSKIAWYLTYNTTVDSATQSADGTTTYQLTTTLTNHLSMDEANSIPQYITGENTGYKRDVTDMIDHVYLIAPLGGTIEDVKIDGDALESYSVNYLDHAAQAVTVRTLGGQTSTITYTVTTSAEAQSELAIHMTPSCQEVAGWE